MNSLAFAQLMAMLWLLSESFIFARDFGSKRGQRRDRGSRLSVFVAMGLSAALALAAVRGHWLVLPGPLMMWQVSGLFLFVIGMLMRHRAVIWLGDYFRTKVTLLDDHRLVTDGPYARVRHPSYTGVLLNTVGFGLATGNGVALIAFALLPMAALAYRITVEEKALAEHFGPEWQAYRGRTHALIAGLW